MFRGLGRELLGTTDLRGGGPDLLNYKLSSYHEPVKTTAFADLTYYSSALIYVIVNHSKTGGNKFEGASEVAGYAKGSNRATLDGAVQWIKPAFLGYDRDYTIDAYPDSSLSRKAQAGPHYYYW